MKIETLKKDYLKRNIIIGVFIVLIISAVILQFTRAKYKSTASVPIVDSEVNYKVYDLKVLAMYQENENGEYISVDVMPSSGYVINETESYCTVDGVNKDDNAKLYTNDNGEHVIANLQKKSKCYLYFEEAKPLLADTIKSYNQSTRTDFSTVYTASTTNTVFTANDGDGTTYYFAGAPTDNYVYFAGYYWRIIRVNGDGTIRLIYQGTSATASSGDAQTGTSAFNSSYNRSEYVGLKYTQGSQYGTNNNSTIYGVLNTWYSNNISGKGYGSYIDTNAGFCNDRDMASGSTWSSQPSSNLYYAAHGRLHTNRSPVYTCNSDNLYTHTSSTKGNKSLSSPIGLITADEVAFAGGLGGTSGTANKSYYLYTGNSYWTMSPFRFSGYPTMFVVTSSGYLDNDGVYGTYGIRPVINLRADTQIQTGTTGTSTNPYVVI